MYDSEYAYGHYVLHVSASSLKYWQSLYVRWYARELKSYIDDGFQYTFLKFQDYLKRLRKFTAYIEASNVARLFRKFSRLATYEFQRGIRKQTRGECGLDIDVAAAGEQPEPRYSVEAMQQALSEMSLADRDLIQNWLLNSSHMRKGFYKRLAKTYGIPAGRVRERVRRAFARLRKILERKVCDD